MTAETGTGMRLEGADRYADWLARIEQMHQDPRPRTNPEPAFAPLARPPAQARVG